MSGAPPPVSLTPVSGPLPMPISFGFLFSLASAFEDIGQAVIGLVARVFVKSVVRVGCERNVDGPGARPCAGILDDRIIAQLVGSDSGEALHNMKLVGEKGEIDPVHPDV